MLKPTRRQRKSELTKWLKLISVISERQYCGRCPYKRYTAPRTDYVVNYNELDKFVDKIMRRRVYCSLNKRRSLDDVCMSDGLKCCGIKEVSCEY